MPPPVPGPSTLAGTTATLAGVYLMADQPIQWTFLPGVTPSVQTFIVRDTDVAATFQPLLRARPVVLEISSPGAVPRPVDLKIHELWITDILPGDNPYTRTIEVSDRRWNWTHKHVVRGYNMQRRTGSTRLVSMSRLQVIETDDILTHKRWSLKDDAPWTPVQVIEDLMRTGGFALPYSWQAGATSLAALEIDNLDLDDNFADALARAVANLPGLEITVDKNGRVVLYDSLSEPSTQTSDGVAALVDSGRIVRQNRKNARPRAVEILMDREVEVRFDGVEGSLTSSGAGTLENVLPSPDPTLTVAGIENPVVCGTWITVDQALAAWAAGGSPGNLPPITSQVVRERWFHGLEQYATLGVMDDPESYWPARISALRQHYRQTYRIQRSWMDVLYSFSPNRVAVLDAETGHAGGASVWTNYCMMVSARGKKALKTEQVRGVNVDGYAAALDDAKAAPMSVAVVDDEVGVIRVSFSSDPLSWVEQFIPSHVDSAPSGDMSGDSGPRHWYDSTVRYTRPTLAEDHGIAVILTVVQAAPNSNERLQKIEVKAREAEKRAVLSGASRTGFSPAEGEPQQHRVGGGLLTAKFAWVESAGLPETYRRLFGFEATIATGPGAPAPAPNVEELWVNRDECVELAEAAAASIYSGQVDRLVGSHAVYLDSGARLDGTASRVTHALSSSGAMTTAWDIPTGEAPRRDIWSLMSSSTRRKLLRLR